MTSNKKYVNIVFYRPLPAENVVCKLETSTISDFIGTSAKVSVSFPIAASFIVECQEEAGWKSSGYIHTNGSLTIAATTTTWNIRL